jgi:hypothetical protein
MMVDIVYEYSGDWKQIISNKRELMPHPPTSSGLWKHQGSLAD